ncbi:la-related protein 6-like [Coturnix japonica]|uniref:la-related protein 6-like n=1 Tax=Coturnix japonica TaxID=93934 RepID=UPI000776E5C0|nr:la-related protein 6-like [Coturnix japonica]
MASRSSVVALGLSSQPSCSTALSAQRNSFPGLHLPSQSCLLSQDSFFKSSNGSFCDTSNAVGSEPFNCSCSIPDPQLIYRIVAQVEFYLSDENLAKDAFLLKHVQKNKLGFVSIKLLTSFKKVKYLTRDWRLTLYALRFSKLLEVNQEGTKVRRRVPIPDSILNIPPTKLLLAWDPLPLEPGDASLPLQKNFIETITQMFSPFGAIASIRILRPGRKLPSDVRKYTAQFPELLSHHCALVEYESLESARRACEELGQPCAHSICVVQLSGKGSKQRSRAEGMELAEMLGWKQRAEAFPYGNGDSLFCSSMESDVASSQLLSAPTWPHGHSFQPGCFSSPFTGSLLSSTAFPPLTAELGFSPKSPDSCWGSMWAPWHSSIPHSPPMDATSPPRTSLAVKPKSCMLRPPHGPDGTKGFYNSIGRGKLVLEH